ncbi:acetoacetate decarboxylase family protein [Rhodococcus sp. X156]|uniref:acetoacetate decarboxylase family protein n=1 Tax=Rhodococcus sp. X156 TaxID=2499145 RepID=UPI000FDB6953|nr:acetoacetate decarboxylase family protein [Rhodococcus sp. X156]
MTISEPSVHLVQGQQVTMPVRIREASAHVAMFSVPVRPAQQVIDYSGLELLQHRPGRAICAVLFVNYVDGDLGQYHEYGVGFMVRPKGAGPKRGDLRSLLTGKAGVFIHRLPVDQGFTLEAGRSIWGFPKVMSEIDLTDTPAGRRGQLRLDDQLVFDLTVGGGVPVPGSGVATSLDAYTHMDGVLRRVPWLMDASGTRFRPGGAKLVLGEHPWADELRQLGLPKRPMLSSTIGSVQMTFEEAETV